MRDYEPVTRLLEFYCIWFQFAFVPAGLKARDKYFRIATSLSKYGPEHADNVRLAPSSKNAKPFGSIERDHILILPSHLKDCV